MIARLGRLAAAALVGVAAATVVQIAPAQAAACTRGTGVTVVVGSDVRCDAGGAGKTAAASFAATGHTLKGVDGDADFICQVDGAPVSECTSTPPASAYWALWWSDGTSGTWSYASRGVNSLKVPAGGFVAFKFGNGRSAPDVTPIGPAPAPAPTKPPSAGGGSNGSGGSGNGGADSSQGSDDTDDTDGATAPSASPSTPKPTPTRTSKKDTKAGATPSATATTPTPVTEEQQALEEASQDTGGAGGSSSLGWVAGGLAVVLVGGMGAVLWRRKVAGGTP